MRASERNRARRLGHAAGLRGAWWVGGEIVTPYRSPALRRVWLAAYNRSRLAEVEAATSALTRLAAQVGRVFESLAVSCAALGPIFARLAG